MVDEARAGSISTRARCAAAAHVRALRLAAGHDDLDESGDAEAGELLAAYTAHEIHALHEMAPEHTKAIIETIAKALGG